MIQYITAACVVTLPVFSAWCLILIAEDLVERTRKKRVRANVNKMLDRAASTIVNLPL